MTTFQVLGVGACLLTYNFIVRRGHHSLILRFAVIKSLFPYLVLVALFILGTRLVNRQMKYKRATQVSTLGQAVSSHRLLESLVVERTGTQQLPSQTNLQPVR
ncbi:hypothetical protein [Spirosoma sp. KNUC1025]|uniref:hypothetical protein n=1 Tax=Spirosoma sp. KNUC1025 TaxID=2894082 RepID=UPI00386AA4C1|nr:hypothetical protein LN737_19490 [Spirosoma sp. KNUC1025]